MTSRVADIIKHRGAVDFSRPSLEGGAGSRDYPQPWWTLVERWFLLWLHDLGEWSVAVLAGLVPPA